MMSRIAAALALTSLAGCADKAVDIGDDTPPAVLGASLSDYEGTWVGYAELAEWDDGTDTVRLVLDDNGNGVIEVGEAELVLPEPDPEAGFPPDLPVHPMAGVMLPDILPGFSYPIEGAIVESNRLRLGTTNLELFREWCELMEPVPNPNSGTGYACLTNWAHTDGTTCTLEGSGAVVDCGKAACLNVCNCDQDGCEIGGGENEDIRMDAALESEGAELEGSLDTPVGRFQVRMTRE
jgi:hypothetical protein